VKARASKQQEEAWTVLEAFLASQGGKAYLAVGRRKYLESVVASTQTQKQTNAQKT
jgi:hypothetical protein